MPDQTPATANSSGLSDKAAGGLAYILVIPAIFFLFTEPYNRNSYIRFHSWQCILMAIAWFILEVVIMIFARFVAVLGPLAYGLDSLVTLGMLILWLMVMIKAFNGERFKLPILGDLAEQQAGR